MLKRTLAVVLGWMALTGMQAPTTPVPPPLMEMWRLDCGDFTFTDYNSFFSDTSEYPSGPKQLVGSCYLIRHGNEYLLWDTGIPAAVVQQPLQTPAIHATLRATLVDQLRRVNVRPEQVTIVGISHYHFDHTGQAASFPNARLIMGAGDLAALRGTDPGVERAPLAHWLTGGGQVTEARGDLDVFGDGKVIMLNLPGHTPGHRGLLVRLASGPVLLSGDTYHFAEQVAHRGVPPFNTSRADSLASMDRFDRLGRNLHAVVIIQHEPADVARLPAFPASAR
jgi:glyoxylase-like metal-dependent hydrolase (beta-lactamase superfamily II)